jgi:hypothetical protein
MSKFISALQKAIKSGTPCLPVQVPTASGGIDGISLGGELLPYHEIDKDLVWIAYCVRKNKSITYRELFEDTNSKVFKAINFIIKKPAPSGAMLQVFDEDGTYIIHSSIFALNINTDGSADFTPYITIPALKKCNEWFCEFKKIQVVDSPRVIPEKLIGIF